MSWITACAKLNGNKTQIRVSVINRPLVRGGHTCINWSRFDTEMLQCSFFFSNLPLMEGLLHYISLPGSS